MLLLIILTFALITFVGVLGGAILFIAGLVNRGVKDRKHEEYEEFKDK